MCPGFLLSTNTTNRNESGIPIAAGVAYGISRGISKSVEAKLCPYLDQVDWNGIPPIFFLPYVG
jgi:hypothetical protein